jgi:hypothetical protein
MYDKQIFLRSWQALDLSSAFICVFIYLKLLPVAHVLTAFVTEEACIAVSR